MAVKKSHRRRGLGSTMMREAIARYPNVELIFPVKEVSFYQQMGVQVIDAENTQVVMNTTSENTPGLMGIVNADQILHSPQAKKIHAQLVGRSGVKVMANAEKQLQREAASYVHTRLATH